MDGYCGKLEQGRRNQKYCWGWIMEVGCIIMMVAECVS